MTMTTSSWNEEREQAKYDRPKRAVDNFNRIAPRLTSYARAMSDGKVKRVIAGARSQTDGSTIYIRPPLSMADRVEHNYRNCDVFGPDGDSLCPACARMDTLMATFTHEMGHILHGSFTEVMVIQFKRVINDRLSSAGTMPTLGLELVSGLDSYTSFPSTLDLVAKHGTPAMKLCTLFAEDMRCNEGQYRLRPNYKRDRFIMHQRVLDEGIEGDDGSYTLWSSMPVDRQFLMAVYMNATNQLLDGRLDDDVVATASNAVFSEFTSRLVNAENSIESLAIVCEFIAAANEHGYLLDPEDDSDDDDKSNDDSEDDDADSDDSDDDSDGGEGDDSDDSDDADGDDEGSGSDSDSGDDMSDEEFMRAVLGHDEDIEHVDAEHGDDDQPKSDDEDDDDNLTKICQSSWVLDRTPVNVGAPRYYARGEGMAYTGGHDGAVGRMHRDIWPVAFAESDVAQAITKARLVFTNNKRAHVTRNLKAGKVSTKVLGKRASIGDERLFARRVNPTARSYHVVASADISYSTNSSMGGHSVMEHIRTAMFALGTTMSRVGVDFSMYAHTSHSEDDGVQHAHMYEIKGASHAWDDETKRYLNALRPCDTNMEGQTLQFLRKQADASDATDKVILLFTDGAMPGYNINEEEYILAQELQVCARKGYTVIAVGIGTDSPTKWGLETVVYNSSADMSAVIDLLATKLR